MIINLKMCMSRSFHSKKSYLCIIGMIAALYINGLGAIVQQKESESFNDIVAVSISSGFIILYYILSVFGGGLNLCQDLQSGYIKFIIAKTKKKDYIKAELLSAFIWGSISALLSIIVFGVLIIFSLIILGYMPRNGIIGDWAYFTENVWTGLIFSLLCGTLSCLAVTVTIFIPNIFVGTAAPILILYMVMTLLNKWCSNIYLLPSCVYFAFTHIFDNMLYHWLYAICYSGCIVFIMYKLCYWKMKRRIQNV